MPVRSRPPLPLLFLLQATAVCAQAPQMILDINPGWQSSNPMSATSVNGKVFFTANTPTTGYELWVTDGTTAGTELVKDIRPGSSSSSPRWFTEIDGTLFFSADDGEHGNELWKSDGSEVGTEMIKDINPVSNNGWYIGNITGLDGLVYFRAAELDHGLELWRTDGTEAGTAMVKDINPGIASSNPSNLYVVNGQLLFWAEDSVHGWGLWRSDGSEAGTVLIKDIDPAGTPSVMQAFYEMDGIAYFAASDTIHGVELWRTDGTEEGTWLVKDILPGVEGSWIAEMRVLEDLVIFSALSETDGRELWKSDGTEDGTTMVIDLNPGPASGPISLFNPVVVEGWLYFVGNDGSAGMTLGLFITNGTTTNLVTAEPGNIGMLYAACGGVFFDGHDGENGWELWRSNGTELGTYMLADIASGTVSSHPGNYVDLGDALFFTASTPAFGIEPWLCPCALVGIEDIAVPQDLQIAPVPSTGPVRIAMPDATTAWDLVITDVHGRIIHSERVTGNTTLDTSSWGSGVYQVQARYKARRGTGRLVVQ